MPIYSKIIRPLLFRLPAETAHEIGIKSLQIGLGTGFAQSLMARRLSADSGGGLKRFGLTFKNPLGMAAGFDKNGKVVNQLSALGFGFVEVGTVTYDPQPGNPQPRLFRLPEDKALINRLGFNNEGTLKVTDRLKALRPDCIVGVNIGKNKDVPNEAATENYLRSFELAFGAADYICVNVSSPNTPNLRELQRSDELERLLTALRQRNLELSTNGPDGAPKPLLVKIAPDLSEAEIEAIADIGLRLKLAGIIATNTTIRRDDLRTGPETLGQIGAGGLSGKPLETRSNEVIRRLYKYSKGRLPVIGVGGVFSAEDAFRKIAAGACLVQAYTGFVYQGITFARDLNSGLAAILKEKGFQSVDQAIGSDGR